MALKTVGSTVDVTEEPTGLVDVIGESPYSVVKTKDVGMR